jgi:hypothetical protein
MGIPLLVRMGPGVEKSIKSSSILPGDLLLTVLRFVRSSSNVGMTLGGVKGTTGLRMDFN